MKKSIVASIIGVVATVAAVQSSYGQGYVAFNNYYSVADQRVTLQGTGAPVDNTWTATLWYAFGGAQLAPLSAANNGVAQFAVNGAPAGYFIGTGVATVPGYNSGPIQFQVRVTNGSGGFGDSALLNLAGIATGTAPVGDLGPDLVAFTVAVPEPSTLALIGLGTGALLFLRRRK